MTKEEMKELGILSRQIKLLQKEIDQTQRESKIVGVYYKDYRSGKGKARTSYEENNAEERINILRGSLINYKRELLQRLIQAEHFIGSLEDPQIRTILRMYYINGNSQQEIAKELNYKQATISNMILSFWENQTA